MSRVCTICVHGNRAELEASLVRGDSIRDIARQYETSKDAVSRHRAHIAPVVHEAHVRANIARSDGLAAQLADLFAEAKEILDNAKRDSKPGLALDAVGKLTKLLELGHRIATTPPPGAPAQGADLSREERRAGLAQLKADIAEEERRLDAEERGLVQ